MVLSKCPGSIVNLLSFSRPIHAISRKDVRVLFSNFNSKLIDINQRYNFYAVGDCLSESSELK